MRIKHTVSSAIGHSIAVLAEQRPQAWPFTLEVPITFGNVARDSAGSCAAGGDNVKDDSHNLSLFLGQRLLFDHPQHPELRIRGCTSDSAGLLEIKRRPFILPTVSGGENQDIRTRFTRTRAYGDGPEGTASGIDESVEVVIVLHYQRISPGAKIRWLRVFPDVGLNLLESRWEGGVDFLVLPQ